MVWLANAEVIEVIGWYSGKFPISPGPVVTGWWTNITRQPPVLLLSAWDAKDASQYARNVISTGVPMLVKCRHKSALIAYLTALFASLKVATLLTCPASCEL